MLAAAVFIGLRIGELLGLTWRDIDFAAGRLRVRYQIANGERVEPKTAQARRDVVLMPALAELLRSHRLAARQCADSDFVFGSATGTPLNANNARRRGLRPAADAAGLNVPDLPRVCFHDCRHSFASLLISQGADVVFVSRQLGHANPSITLAVYAHLFDAHRHADAVSEKLEQEFGDLLGSRHVGRSAADEKARDHVVELNGARIEQQTSRQPLAGNRVETRDGR